jgi:hypothetical protein
MLTRTIQAHTCMFTRAPVHSCAPATRAQKLLLAICSQALSPGDLPSRPLSQPAHPARARRCFCARYTRDTRALLHVYTRARSRLHACYTRASVVACARSLVSKHTRGRRGGREACFLYLYEPI